MLESLGKKNLNINEIKASFYQNMQEAKKISYNLQIQTNSYKDSLEMFLYNSFRQRVSIHPSGAVQQSAGMAQSSVLL